MLKTGSSEMSYKNAVRHNRQVKIGARLARCSFVESGNTPVGAVFAYKYQAPVNARIPVINIIQRNVENSWRPNRSYPKYPHNGITRYSMGSFRRGPIAPMRSPMIQTRLLPPRCSHRSA